jgi:hypothetical protein
MARGTAVGSAGSRRPEASWGHDEPQADAAERDTVAHASDLIGGEIDEFAPD